MVSVAAQHVHAHHPTPSLMIPAFTRRTFLLLGCDWMMAAMHGVMVFLHPPVLTDSLTEAEAFPKLSTKHTHTHTRAVRISSSHHLFNYSLTQVSQLTPLLLLFISIQNKNL